MIVQSVPITDRQNFTAGAQFLVAGACAPVCPFLAMPLQDVATGVADMGMAISDLH